jgi:nitrogen fixation NifU-like protein
MDESLKELYQAIILDHSKHPHNQGALEPCTHCAEGLNPLCGDEVKVYLQAPNQVVDKIQFTGQGCAISKASASLMTLQLQGKSIAEAKQTFDRITQFFMDGQPEAASLEDLGDLAALAGVSQFPARIKCATLPWHTFLAALNHQSKVEVE